MEVVVPFGVSKAGFLSGCPVELGVVAASKEGTEDAEFHADELKYTVFFLIKLKTKPLYCTHQGELFSLTTHIILSNQVS